MVNVYQLIECGDDEMNLVKSKIEKHVELTGSERGKVILADQPAVAGKFLKIMPQDYERVLQAQACAKSADFKVKKRSSPPFEENVKAGTRTVQP